MKELILWKEVDVKDELPQENAICFRGDKKLLFQWKGEDLKQLNVTHWLKRVVIPILSDQEIEELDNSFEGLMPRFIWKEGYKAMQERLMANEK